MAPMITVADGSCQTPSIAASSRVLVLDVCRAYGYNGSLLGTRIDADEGFMIQPPVSCNATAPSCSVLLRPAPSCSVLLRPAPSCSVLLRPAPSCSVLLRPAPSCSVLLRPAPSCSVLLRPAPSCSVLLRPAPRETKRPVSPDRSTSRTHQSCAISAADDVAASVDIHTLRTTPARGAFSPTLRGTHLHHAIPPEFPANTQQTRVPGSIPSPKPRRSTL